ncbi:FOG: CheY-like receiver [hydrothermal vent metagenome]|uniref:FOG: CheY-like receiver n=1 Tax=hydrothermal vent metagenome TaxID=652676 RepID=A0A1W1CCQ3_9ZZZZ
MKKLFDKLKQFGRDEGKQNSITTQQTSDPEVLEQYRIDTKKINIEKQPFRLSGLLHILTNKIGKELKAHNHKLHYDVEQEVGRYIVGDNDYIEQILEPLLKQLISLNNNSEIILNISKHKNHSIIFDASNPHESMPKTLYKEYEQAEQTSGDRSEVQNTYIKVKRITEAMGGSLELKNSRFSGTHFIFRLSYIEDRGNRSNQDKLKKSLKGKHALFIDKTNYETKRAQYIFKAFGLKIENMKIEKFDKTKPDLGKYDMAVVRSADLTAKHIGFFKNFHKNRQRDFKLIIIHELFEHENRINMTKLVADAELYNPTIIGDVEEILNQMFILKSKAVKGISNIEIFDPSSFAVVGHRDPSKKDMEYFKGAHIAVAEDSKIDMRVMRNIIDVEGIRLFTAGNGKELINILKTEEIDLVFTDINMPVMDGLTMTKEIRTEPKWKDLPIISISSMAFGHEIKAMQVAGMNASIAKPITAQDVYQALERFLKITPAMQARYAQQIREQHTPSVYKGNSEILDVQKGVREAGGKLQYLELLNETMEVLEGSQNELKNLIIEGEYIALKSFSRSMINLYSNIHAVEMTALFNEISMYVSTKNKKTYLSEYILLYTKNRQHLEKEIESFSKYLLEQAPV